MALLCHVEGCREHGLHGEYIKCTISAMVNVTPGLKHVHSEWHEISTTPWKPWNTYCKTWPRLVGNLEIKKIVFCFTWPNIDILQNMSSQNHVHNTMERFFNITTLPGLSEVNTRIYSPEHKSLYSLKLLVRGTQRKSWGLGNVRNQKARNFI